MTDLTEEIRPILRQNFSDQELDELCWDRFHEVQQDFSQGMSKGQKIQLLLEYCQNRDQMAELVRAITHTRRGQFPQLEDVLKTIDSASDTPDRITRIAVREIEPKNLRLMVELSSDGSVKWSTVKTVVYHLPFGNLFVDRTSPVHSVKFSPDGTTLAFAGPDKRVYLWDKYKSTLLKRLEGHTKKVVSLAFSPDGRTLASGSLDRSIRLWKVSDGTCHQELSENLGPVSVVDFSPDGKIICSGEGSGKICLWRVSDGKCLDVKDAHH